MYALNELVNYGAHGVCRVTDTEVQKVGGKQISYLVLVPVEQPGAKFLVPQSSAAAMAKLRPLISKDALLAALNPACIGDAWIADEGARKLQYKSLLSGGSPTELAAMLFALYAQKKQQLSAGKKFHMSDDLFLRDAEKLLASETAVVLGLSYPDALQHIRTTLDI